ncbi:hypothetical protein GCK72_017085 [Caenorhabditis remanei]|uniref:Uncharacterized protein n=1 Tax=Caenorhabditis remanei TaxID=31234 RepID=A0A6A5G793_CAERE|nr:hypothetical protein GCK72_017085 [Caenorhabditis remanei]KAF1750535.1 hypothetical protein GCK72_017085 [Caenorhabditis remanei]
MTIAISLHQSKELSPEEKDLRIYYYPFTYFHSVLSRKIQKCSKVTEKEMDMLKEKLTGEWKWKQYEVCDKLVENCTFKLQLTFITMLLCAVVSKDILDMARLDFWIQCCIFGIESVLFLVIVQQLWCQRRQIKSECESEKKIIEEDIENGCNTRFCFDSHNKSDKEQLMILKNLYSQEIDPLNEKIQLLHNQTFCWTMFSTSVIILFCWYCAAQPVMKAFKTGSNEDIKLARRSVALAVWVTLQVSAITWKEIVGKGNRIFFNFLR